VYCEKEGKGKLRQRKDKKERKRASRKKRGVVQEDLTRRIRASKVVPRKVI